MTDPLQVPAGERETIRVFALDLPGAVTEALAEGTAAPNGAPPPLAALFGVGSLDRTYVEIFPASDLKGVGLAGYITEGLGVDPADVAGDRERLDAETGTIAILHARAFAGGGATLTPGDAVRVLGAYRLAQAEPPALTLPETPGDKPAPAPADTRPAPPARLPRSLALLGLLAAAVIALCAAYLIGAQGR